MNRFRVAFLLYLTMAFIALIPAGSYYVVSHGLPKRILLFLIPAYAFVSFSCYTVLKRTTGGTPLSRRLIVICVMLVLFVAALALWSADVDADRRHTVTVESETPVFAGSGDDSCSGTEVGLAQAGEVLRVRRIRYWKNCATIDVATPHQESNHLVWNGRTFTVKPPLP